jgi:hypothetical protein
MAVRHQGTRTKYYFELAVAKNYQPGSIKLNKLGNCMHCIGVVIVK